MTAHLTNEELTDNLLGVSSLTVNTHLLECTSCAQELQQLKGSMADFRGAALSWSEDAAVVERGTPRRVPMKSRPAAGWILVAAAMVLFIAGATAYLHQNQIGDQTPSAQVSTPSGNPGVSQSQLDQDNQLLSQVSSELSEAVPAPMQPLLVSESSGANAVTSK
jgi:hypothetical protein